MEQNLFPSLHHQYNVANATNGMIMLGCDVPTLAEAKKYADYYNQRYGPGIPYPNGKGEYDGSFYPVIFDHDCYRPVV